MPPSFFIFWFPQTPLIVWRAQLVQLFFQNRNSAVHHIGVNTRVARAWRGHSVAGLTVAAALAYAGAAPAFEETTPHPGARAMGMAGVFGPQADDCSAVWYNPGGLPRPDMIRRDITVEYGALPSSTSNREYQAASALKFACGYWAANDGRLGVGLAYATLYRLGFNIEEVAQPLSLKTFGPTDITYRQASMLLSTALNQQLAVGGTLDFVWTDVDCSYDTCVDFGAMALSASFGAAWDMVRTPSQRIAVTGLWRARAALRYYDTPGAGIGAVLDKYVPDRPQTFGIGVHAQFSTRYAAVNGNATIEHISWSTASASRAPSPDFNKLGAGGEILVPISDGASFAVRAGVTSARADHGDVSANVYALGTGITWGSGHGIDIALERRTRKDFASNGINHVSMSYSWQR